MDDTIEKLERAISDHDDVHDLRNALETIIKSSPEFRLAQYFGQCFLRHNEAFATACREACGLWENEFRVICAAWAFSYYGCNDKAVTDPLKIVLDDEGENGGDAGMSLLPGWKRYYCPRTFKP